MEQVFDQSLREYITHNLKNIKLVYRTLFDIFLVTYNDKVLVMGRNENSILGLGHDHSVLLPKEIPQLCYKRICDFIIFQKHCFARTSNGNVYVFGNPDYTDPIMQLIKIVVNLFTNRAYDDYKPKRVDVFRHENIIDMCSGGYHALFLTQNGEVYACGNNSFGQTGHVVRNISIVPAKIQFKDVKIVKISSGMRHSMALTENGKVLSWGSNEHGQLGLDKFTIKQTSTPLPVEKKDDIGVAVIFIRVSCGFEHSLLLSNDGTIYCFGRNDQNQLSTGLIKGPDKYLEVRCLYNQNISTAFCNDGHCYIWGQCGSVCYSTPHKSEFRTCEETILQTYKITVNAMVFMTGRKFYCYDFQELEIIAMGGFGIVTKVLERKTRNLFAIKRVPFGQKSEDETDTENFVMREVNIMSDIKSCYTIEIKSFWVEDNYLLNEGQTRYEKYVKEIKKSDLFDIKNRSLLHLKMELAYKPLNDILKQIQTELHENDCDIKSLTSYYITSELFKEILEAVDYLHSRSPPIIHRDLKPSNVLIRYPDENGRFAVLGDFGLAKIQNTISQSNTSLVGTPTYMAPEIRSGRNYSTKADIYSLGAFIPIIFNFDLNEENKPYIENANLRSKYEGIYNLCVVMAAIIVRSRITCEDALKREDWSLQINDVLTDNPINEEIEYDMEENFCSYFLKTKSKVNFK